MKINLFDLRQTRHYTEKHLARFDFILEIFHENDNEKEAVKKLLESLEKASIRKDRFGVKDYIAYKNGYILSCKSLHGFGYDFKQDFEHLFKNYRIND